MIAYGFILHGSEEDNAGFFLPSLVF